MSPKDVKSEPNAISLHGTHVPQKFSPLANVRVIVSFITRMVKIQRQNGVRGECHSLTNHKNTKAK